MNKEYGPDDIARLENRVAQLEKFSHAPVELRPVIDSIVREKLRAKWIVVLRDGTQLFGNNELSDDMRRELVRLLDRGTGFPRGTT